MNKILVIKLSALGDFIQALGPMKAIRAHHSDAHITLLTTKPFEKMARDSGYFDEIWLDKRPKLYQIGKWFSHIKKLNSGKFDRAYDLQNNDRTGLYFKFMAPKPQWVGVARGASHRNIAPERSLNHAFYGHQNTLALAGIDHVDFDDLQWMVDIAGDIKKFDDLKENFALFIPGCSPQHPEKRWPAENFIKLAKDLLKRNIQPVLIGTQDEADVNTHIASSCPGVLDLTGRTSLYDIPALAHGAEFVVGNDTGPMHMAATTGTPCVALFCTRKSDPRKHGPIGKKVVKIKAYDLINIPPSQVWSNYQKLTQE